MITGALSIFPYPCISIARGNSILYHEILLLSETSTQWKSEEHLRPMVTRALTSTACAPHIWSTFSEPGPYSSLRAGLSFIHGLCAGSGARLCTPSFFQALHVYNAQSRIRFPIYLESSPSMVYSQSSPDAPIMHLPYSDISDTERASVIRWGRFPFPVHPCTLLLLYAKKFFSHRHN